MEIESAHPVGQEQVELHGNSVEGQTVWSGFQDTWLQSPSKAALPEQLQGFQVAVEQLQHMRDGLSWTQGQHQALEMLLQECQALKTQLRQSKALTQEQEREHSLQIERHQHMREQLRQAETSVHILESILDLYKKKYRAALGRVGELDSQMHHLQEEVINLWSSSQAEDSLGQLSAHAVRQFTDQQDQTIQELQEQLAASHCKLLQQKEAVARLSQEFASYKLIHNCSNTKHRKQMVSQAILQQKLQQAEEEGLHQQAEVYQALVQELKMQLAREAEQNSSTLKDLARLELAVQSLCQAAASEQSQQLQHHACLVQALLEQSHQLCAQKEWKPARLLQRAWANCSIFWDQAHPLKAASQEAKQGRAASWPGGAPVLQLRRPKSPEQPGKAALEMVQDQPVERGLKLQRLGKVGCPLEVLLGKGCLAEAELEQKSFLGGDGLAAATSGRELLKELMEKLSRSKRQPLQAAPMLELERLRQQLQETERRVQALQTCVMEQKADSRSLQEQLTKQTAVLGLVNGRFRQARLQLQHQATAQIESLQISLEASRAGHHWLHQESELVVADVRQWVKEQKQMNEELGHKLRTQIKQIAQLTGERDLLHQLLERLQEDNQQLKNEINERCIVCERIKASAKNDQRLEEEQRMPNYSPPPISLIVAVAERDCIKLGSPTPCPQTQTSLQLVGNWATQVVGSPLQ
ncbi:polyamine-modulated factor 1-binding protein 1 [Pantherophis guttatus]|uniref:Polyamine-modulated factor 1-binding protein 1 n=1 Tax=Pantherophis guttatus TaxID=94885 RepID=A0A6P9CS74_PANGU|nr:polyamine-modulated factor 1-binding protein 1 [Pantherophis guttatus]XP_034282622.1 polyamine-modulated factor 1-binding protein 1 [Pantherophis guttatus]XP_034282623.1 polyamine-modulated factor 1-binding protein 1 [Pantherophis guttatus]XP_034282624.1 polyamine-modulated factor 1-binding protein 1 [Pantherophis guttatus]XP_034282625.1 polyamine-modulated factor 1-binding protein 1 [Pantherophis guttatus]